MKLNKKMVIVLASVIGVIVVLIIVIMLFIGGGSKILSYERIEEKILSAGENYFNDNKDKLPEVGTTSVDVKTLIEDGYLNELSEYTEEGVACDGKAYVTKTPSEYLYRANLDCGKDYITKTLATIIKSNVVDSGNGVYELQQIDPNNTQSTHTVYAFRGDAVNNYIKVGDYHWRIVKVYENGEVAILGDPRLLNSIWDDRYNIEVKDYVGINDYSVSRIHELIETDVVNNKDGFLNIKKLITSHTACIGKRGLDDTSMDGSTECSRLLKNQYFSLLPMYDYLNASLDVNCTDLTADSCFNYNYLSSLEQNWWTITAADFNNQDVYYIDNVVYYDEASDTNQARLYAHLDANVTYVSGSGTYEDPYIVK